mmetsp:Transcript_6703/g.9959  ORF Transcript_6703/g.9959 Transcript_6703/m.9959 type:complete len:255 (+) Transcript_6703:258-1022(+)
MENSELFHLRRIAHVFVCRLDAAPLNSWLSGSRSAPTYDRLFGDLSTYCGNLYPSMPCLLSSLYHRMVLHIGGVVSRRSWHATYSAHVRENAQMVEYDFLHNNRMDRCFHGPLAFASYRIRGNGNICSGRCLVHCRWSYLFRGKTQSHTGTFWIPRDLAYLCHPCGCHALVPDVFLCSLLETSERRLKRCFARAATCDCPCVGARKVLFNVYNRVIKPTNLTHQCQYLIYLITIHFPEINYGAHLPTEFVGSPV